MSRDKPRRALMVGLLPGELARADALLDDRAFFAPFARFFDPLIGRPSTPVECYLRLMFVKFRYRLGEESLCAGVADSISWRRFCRIPIVGRVPRRAREMTAQMRARGKLGNGESTAAIRRVSGGLADLADKTERRLPQCCATAAGRCPGRSAGGCGGGCLSWRSRSSAPARQHRPLRRRA